MAYVVIWEFKVRPDMRKAFEDAYGVHGEWARFFREDPAYIRTELIRDVHEHGRYLTLDFWASEAAYETFRERRKDEYRTIDSSCDEMTEVERETGRFTGVEVGD